MQEPRKEVQLGFLKYAHTCLTTSRIRLQRRLNRKKNKGSKEFSWRLEEFNQLLALEFQLCFSFFCAIQLCRIASSMKFHAYLIRQMSQTERDLFFFLFDTWIPLSHSNTGDNGIDTSIQLALLPICGGQWRLENCVCVKNIPLNAILLKICKCATGLPTGAFTEFESQITATGYGNNSRRDKQHT